MSPSIHIYIYSRNPLFCFRLVTDTSFQIKVSLNAVD